MKTRRVTLTIHEGNKKDMNTVTCSECGAEMPDDTYARTFGRCAKHADEEKTRRAHSPELELCYERISWLEQQLEQLQEEVRRNGILRAELERVTGRSGR
jgi:hypothetical protein